MGTGASGVECFDIPGEAVPVRNDSHYTGVPKLGDCDDCPSTAMSAMAATTTALPS